MAVNLLGGSKFKMPQRPSEEDVSRIYERGQKKGSANWNVSVPTHNKFCCPNPDLRGSLP